MKKIIIAIVTLITIIGFAACKKEEKKSATNTTPTLLLNAKINGVEYAANTVLCSKSPDTPIIASLSGFINYKGDTYGISLAVDNFKGAKTYSAPDGFIALSKQNSFDGYQSNDDETTVSITFTEDDNVHAKGNFSGKLFNKDSSLNDSVMITDGSFYVNWIK